MSPGLPTAVPHLRHTSLPMSRSPPATLSLHHVCVLILFVVNGLHSIHFRFACASSCISCCTSSEKPLGVHRDHHARGPTRLITHSFSSFLCVSSYVFHHSHCTLSSSSRVSTRVRAVETLGQYCGDTFSTEYVSHCFWGPKTTCSLSSLFLDGV